VTNQGYITIQVVNFGGLANGTIKIPSLGASGAWITMLLGNNHQGKSSFLRGSGRAAAGVGYKDKKEAAKDLKRGESTGFVKITREGYPETFLSLPTGELSGQAVKASRVAVGFEHLMDKTKKEERFKLISTALKTVPEKEDLAVEFKKEGYSDVDVDNAWRVICSPNTGNIDWENAHTEYTSNRTTLSRRWCETTGKGTYGKADEWFPEGYQRAELLAADPDALDNAITAAEGKLTAAQSNQAISLYEYQQLQTTVDGIPAQKERYETCRTRSDEIDKELAELSKYVDSSKVIKCRECGCDQLIVNDTSVDPATMTVDKAKVQKRAQLEKEQKNLIAEAEGIAARLDTANRAKERLAETPAPDAAGIEKAQANLKAAKAKQEAYATLMRANDLHAQIKKCDVLKKLTANDGVPATKLRPALEKFNKLLADICEIGNWQTIKVETDGSVTQDGMEAERRSDSEQLRIKIALQLAFARYDGSDLVLLDRIELLDDLPGGLPGLVYVLDEVRIPIVMAGMANSKKHAETLSRDIPMEDGSVFRYGSRYWVADGVIEDLSPPPETSN